MDFDLASLYKAIDEQREARGMNWQQALREINGVSGRVQVHPISRSTVSSLRTRSVAEGDGVLQMLRWLNRTPESFVPCYEEATSASFNYQRSHQAEFSDSILWNYMRYWMPNEWNDV